MSIKWFRDLFHRLLWRLIHLRLVNLLSIKWFRDNFIFFFTKIFFYYWLTYCRTSDFETSCLLYLTIPCLFIELVNLLSNKWFRDTNPYICKGTTEEFYWLTYCRTSDFETNNRPWLSNCTNINWLTYCRTSDFETFN